MKRSVFLPVVLAGLLANTIRTWAQLAPSASDYAAERAERAKDLTQPYGWFSLVALEWLKPGVTTVGSAKSNSVVLVGAPAHLMTLEQSEGKVLPTAVSAGVTLRGQPVPLHVPLTDEEEDRAAVASGSLRMWAIDRGGKRYLRVKDSNAPALKSFRGLRWYAPSAKYRVEARWVPFTTRHTLHFLNQLGQVSDAEEPGQVEFTIDGRRCTLTPLSATDKGLWFVLRDLTAAKDTDQGGRFLYTDAPSNGLKAAGTVLLDFNEAVNPPCAYSPFATCPLAAPENRLPVAIAAGEKRYE